MTDFLSNTTLILGITTPITLIAFFIAVYYGFKYRKSKLDVEKLRLANESERGSIIKSLEVDYPSLIDLNKFSENKRYNLAMKQIENREKTRKRNFWLTLVIASLGTIVVLAYVFFPPNGSLTKIGFIDLHKESIEFDKNTNSNILCTYSANCESQTTNDSSFTNIYFKANENLVKHIVESKNSAQIIFVSAVAGYGKTTFMDELCDKILKDYSKVNIIDLNQEKKLFSVNRTDLTFETTSDNKLVDINTLPYIDYNKFTIQDLFGKNEITKQFIILDDLDEVHPELAKYIIQKSFLFINNSNTPKTLLLIGRPEVFNEYMRLPDFKKGYKKAFHAFDLEPIKYNTYANIKLRLLNYNSRNNINWSPNQIDEYTLKICNFINANPFISYSFSNLSLGNIIIPNIINDIQTDSLKKYLFSDLLDRANKKHFRPSYSKPSNLENYIDALEFISAKYKSIDSEGFFIVQPTDYIEFSSVATQSSFKVNVVSMLNRSGLVTLKPFNDKSMKYRFEPFWVHQYLIDGYNSKCK
jgi:hypothetical protein